MNQVNFVSSFNIMVLSDDQKLAVQLEAYLKPFGYMVTVSGNALEGLDQIRANRPDLVLADIALTPLTGFELCRSIKQDPGLKNTPVILVAGNYSDVDQKVKALSVDADDIIYRPVHGGELRARLRASLRLKAYVQQVLSERQRLEEMVSKRTREIEEMTVGLVAALEKASSLNDDDTGNHIQRVCLYSAVLAQGLGMEAEQVERIRLYASLHDVGKVGLPDSILKKTGKLTEEEHKQMQAHTLLGHELLVTAHAAPEAQSIALYHHEWYDGSGYPTGLSADAIPIEARIVCLADVYDALTSDRCYRDAVNPSEAARMIVDDSNSHFDPTVINVFMRNHSHFLAIRNRYKNRGVKATAFRPGLHG
jgi:putative two-component system response regulator